MRNTGWLGRWAISLFLLLYPAVYAGSITLPLPIGFSVEHIRDGYIATSLAFTFEETRHELSLIAEELPPPSTAEGAAVALAKILFAGDRKGYETFRHPNYMMFDHFDHHRHFYVAEREALLPHYELYSTSKFPDFYGAALRCTAPTCTEGDIKAGWDYPLLLEKTEQGYVDARGRIMRDIVAQHYVAALRARSTNKAFARPLDEATHTLVVPEAGTSLHFEGVVPRWGQVVFRGGKFAEEFLPPDASDKGCEGALKFFRDAWQAFASIPEDGYASSPEFEKFLSYLYEPQRGELEEFFKSEIFNSEAVFPYLRASTLSGGLIVRFVVTADPVYLFICTPEFREYKELAVHMVVREAASYHLIGLHTPSMTQALFYEPRVHERLLEFVKALPCEF